jgi:predicted RNA-binding Zn-ribbon protein involved in translation (DUF1610 family)
MSEPKTKPMGIVVEADTGAQIASVKCSKCGTMVDIHGHTAKVSCPKCGNEVPALK